MTEVGDHVKNAIALEKLKAEFKGKVEVLQLPVPVLRDLKKLAAEVVREESEKTPMARKVHASFTKFQALVAKSKASPRKPFAGVSAAVTPE